MKVLLIVALALVALTAARPSDVIDIEQDHMEHEQEGVPGTAVEGEYSWVAPDGNEYVIKYVADTTGTAWSTTTSFRSSVTTSPPARQRRPMTSPMD
nr:uncharacterized protein LOC113821793 [Penaeus vannamei]